MSEHTIVQQQIALTELAAKQDADVETLLSNIWPAVNSVIDNPDTNALLLDDTKPLVDRLVLHPELAIAPEGYIPQYYFSAHTLRANWGMLTAYARNESITSRLREETCRDLGRIIVDVTDANFNLEAMEPRNAQRTSQTAILQLLNRNSNPLALGFPSDPRHHNPGRDRANPTFNIHAWSPSQNSLIRLAVQTSVRQGMEHMPRFRDSLLVGFGEVALETSMRIPSIREYGRPPGSSATMGQVRRRLINHAARLLAIDSGAEIPTRQNPLSGDERQWLTNMSGRIFNLIRKYVPK